MAVERLETEALWVQPNTGPIKTDLRPSRLSDYGSRKRLAFHTLLALDEDGHLKYPKQADVIRNVYADMLEGLSPADQAKLIRTTGNSGLYNLVTSLEEQLRRVRSGDRLHSWDLETKADFEEIRTNYPVYQTMPLEEIIKVLRRKPGTPLTDYKPVVAKLAVVKKPKIRAPKPEKPAKPEKPPRPASSRPAKEKAVEPEIIEPVAVPVQIEVPVPSQIPEIEAPLALPMTAVSTVKPAAENVEKSSELENCERVFGYRQKEIIFALLQGNATRDDFLYPTTMDVAKAVYADKIITLRGVASEKRLANLDRTVFLSRANFITRLYATVLNPEHEDEVVEEILAEIHSIPQYSTLSAGRLMRILRRHMKFSEIQDPNPEYDKIEDVGGIPVTNRKIVSATSDGQAPIVANGDSGSQRSDILSEAVDEDDQSITAEDEISEGDKDTSPSPRTGNAVEQIIYHTPFSDEHTYTIGTKIICLNREKPDFARSLGIRKSDTELQILIDLEIEYRKNHQGVVDRAGRVRVPAERSIDHLLAHMDWRDVMIDIDPNPKYLADNGLPPQPPTWRGQVLGIVGHMKSPQLRAFKRALGNLE